MILIIKSLNISKEYKLFSVTLDFIDKIFIYLYDTLVS